MLTIHKVISPDKNVLLRENIKVPVEKLAVNVACHQVARRFYGIFPASVRNTGTVFHLAPERGMPGKIFEISWPSSRG